MSQRTERIRESFEDSEAVLEWFTRWYHVPVLALLLAFMLWVRARSWENYVTGGEVMFSGNDAWYHLRMVRYTVHNWPETMPFDPWTHFPVGTSVGQFGTLFDQLIATAALVVGLGSPTPKQVALVHLFAPAVFGTLVAIPAYLLGKRFGGRFGGIVGVLVLAFTPGQFLSRSLVGFSDHHVAETLFMTTAVLAVAVAVSVAEEEMPVYELFETREWEALRRPVAWAALAGVAVGLYIWVWPPGVFLVGILGVFFALAMSLHFLRGVSPDHVAIVGAIAMAVTGLVTLIPMNTFEPSATDFSFVQPLLAFMVAAGCAFVAATARVWDDRDLPRLYYPVALASLAVAAAALVAVALPTLFGFLQTQILRVVGLGATDTALTVAEAKPVPLDNAAGFFQQSYGLAYLTAFVGLLVLVGRAASAEWPRAEHVLVAVWTVFLVFATLTQRRFDYYLVAAVATLNAYLVGEVFALIGAHELDDVLDVEFYQVLAVLAVVVVVVVPLAVSGAGVTVVAATDSTSPGEVTAWDGSLDWLADNTPEEGLYGGANNELSYYGTYERQEDFAYQEGQYGVLSWWDYGHWITVEGQRIPFANPFQQGATDAANYLLSTNATSANQRLVSDSGEETRFVVLDHKMADTSLNLANLFVRTRPKFTAPYAWEDAHSRNRSDDFEYVFDTQNRTAFTLHHQPYYESMRVRLYQYHGSAIEPKPYVVDYEVATSQSGQKFKAAPQGSPVVRRFDNVSAARQYAKQDGTAQVGGLKGPFPEKRVPALEHYRLVHASETSAFASRAYQVGVRQYAQATGINPNAMFYTSPQWVKTFERVPGATVKGQGPPNATVTASVRMRMPNSNQTFTYRQQARTDENGNFTMTLPYSTTGYDRLGTQEGYTNVSVRKDPKANYDGYAFTATVRNETGARIQYGATANVTEAQVVGVDDSPVRVELSQSLVIPGQRGNDTNTTGGNTTGAGNGTDGGNASGPGGNSTGDADGTATETGSAHRPPGAAAPVAARAQ